MSKGYVGKNKISGVTSRDKTLKEQIYQRYIAAYKKGVFNYIKEEGNTTGEAVPHKYFSGGELFGNIQVSRTKDAAMLSSVIGKLFSLLFNIQPNAVYKAKGALLLFRRIGNVDRIIPICKRSS